MMYEQQIAKGMVWLDANHPGWVDRVDMDSLELDSCATCVLGQLGGYWAEVGGACGFSDALMPNFADGDLVPNPFDTRYREVKRVGFAWSNEHGFSTQDYFVNYETAYRDLTAEWRAAIQRRRDEALPDPIQAPWWADGVREPVIVRK